MKFLNRMRWEPIRDWALLFVYSSCNMIESDKSRRQIWSRFLVRIFFAEWNTISIMEGSNCCFFCKIRYNLETIFRLRTTISNRCHLNWMGYYQILLICYTDTDRKNMKIKLTNKLLLRRFQALSHIYFHPDLFVCTVSLIWFFFYLWSTATPFIHSFPISSCDLHPFFHFCNIQIVYFM